MTPLEPPPELLLRAYAIGVFPMAEDFDSPRIEWIEPRRRGIIPLDAFHVPRSLRKAMRRGGYEARLDHDFATVIRNCATPTLDRPRTWLNQALIRSYTALAQAGFAHSVEIWRDGALAGGLYGVRLGGAFFGESMFSRVRDSSKIALVHLVELLNAGGFVLLDAQFVTDHLQQFGAIEIGRHAYLARLRAALQVQARFPPSGPLPGNPPA
ncbi:MAG: leucyl/phenylalanyl-tRNA--protein transferase [Geminicoccaceae bacterium]